MPIIDARYYRTVVVCPNQLIANELAPLLAHGLPLAQIHEMKDYPTRRNLVDMLKALDPKLLFIDFTKEVDRAFAFLMELRSLTSAIPIVALLAGNDPDMILRCLRQGATDFLIRPFTTDQIDAAIEKIVRLYPAPHSKSTGGGKVIGVFPAKGACGATTIACNLAYQSKRLGHKKILLADLDPLTGTVSFLFKLKSTYSFLDVLHRQHQLDADLWKQMTQTHQGVDLLLAPETLVDGLDGLTDITPILDFAQRTYDILLLDCGDAYTEWNLSIARTCDELLLLTTNELAALQATQKVLAHFDQNRIDHSKLRIVVNRYDRDVGLNIDVIGTALECDVFQTIPSDYETVQRSLMDGKPIPANSVLGKSLTSLADKVCGKREAGDDDKKSAAAKGLFSMFSRASS